MCLLDIAVYTILLNTNTTDSNKIKHLLLTIFMASYLFYLTLWNEFSFCLCWESAVGDNDNGQLFWA